MKHRENSRNVLMVCSSVFQLYVAILIKCYYLKNQEVDLLLTDTTPLFHQLSKNEYLRTLFHTVRYCTVGQNWKTLTRIEKSHYFQSFFELFPKYYVKRVWQVELCRYDELFFSTYLPFNIMLQACIKQQNKKAKIHLFEDGVSTYLIDCTYQYKLPSLLKRVFHVEDIRNSIQDIYVFQPELFCLEMHQDLVRLPTVTEYPEVVSTFNKLFGHVDYEIQERFIFFEESFHNDGYTTNDDVLIQELWTLCNGNDFILKHHPRNKADRFQKSIPVLNMPIFWEHYLVNHSLERQVLVTVSSNTVFTPKIIADREPTIILLYKLFQGTSPLFQSGNFEKYVEKYLQKFQSYSQRKIYIPETMDEFRKIVRTLQGRE